MFCGKGFIKASEPLWAKAQVNCKGIENHCVNIIGVPSIGFNDLPVDDEIKALCEDVLTRWYAEKDGEADTGRVLPSDYLWFSGDGKHNYFRNAYKGGETWGWSLPSPYET